MWFAEEIRGGKGSSAKVQLGQWNRVAISDIYSTAEIGFYVNGNVNWIARGYTERLLSTYGDIYFGSRQNPFLKLVFSCVFIH